VEFDPPGRASDALAGTLNRRAFHDSIQQRPESWPAHWRMGLALIDVVGMQLLNEEHGHVAGDSALQCVAAAIPRTEPHEWVSRYGGDEFAVVLAMSDPADAQEWAELALERISAHVERDLSITIGTRIGIAVGEPGWWPSDIYSQAISPADAALAQAMRGDPPREVVVVEMSGDG
jgi:diguanylate cyclase (GGDEF)-like protein